MPSTRLTDAHRRQIINAAMRHRFGDREKWFAARSESLFQQLRLAKFGKAAITQMDALPEGWLPRHTRFDLRVNNEGTSIASTSSARMPAESGYSIEMDKLPARLRERVTRHVVTRAAFKADQKSLNQQLSAALHTFGTLESLLKKWPELAPFTKGIEPAAANLPAKPFTEINKALGIGA